MFIINIYMPLTDPLSFFLKNQYKSIEERDEYLEKIINECEDFIEENMKYTDAENLRISLHNKICELEKDDPRFKKFLKL